MWLVFAEKKKMEKNKIKKTKSKKWEKKNKSILFSNLE